jgi:hypothetical protein
MSDHGEESNATLAPITGGKFLDGMNNQQLFNKAAYSTPSS